MAALTKNELIASLQNEVRILLHLASKIEPPMLDYRPTPKQRSTIELLRYLVVMGPELVKGIKSGGFNMESWSAAKAQAEAADFEQILALIGKQPEQYQSLLGDMSDEDLRGEIEMFGRRSSRGPIIVNMVLCGCAAYRTQLFLYLKACGREELSTMNLWGGVDAPAPQPA